MDVSLQQFTLAVTGSDMSLPPSYDVYTEMNEKLRLKIFLNKEWNDETKSDTVTSMRSERKNMEDASVAQEQNERNLNI